MIFNDSFQFPCPLTCVTDLDLIPVLGPGLGTDTGIRDRGRDLATEPESTWLCSPCVNLGYKLNAPQNTLMPDAQPVDVTDEAPLWGHGGHRHLGQWPPSQWRPGAGLVSVPGH